MKQNKKLLKFTIIGLSLIIVVLLTILIFKDAIELFLAEDFSNNNIEKKEVKKEKKNQKFQYGFNLDSFEVETKTVEKNQNLSKILENYYIPYSTIDKIVIKSKSVFDLRKIQSGKKYSIFLLKNKQNNLKHFVYDHSKREYLLISFFGIDSVRLKKIIRPTKKINKKISGTITKGSLWQTMKDSGINPVLSVELSKIFEWDIDFFAIKKGDEFKIIYDEEFIKGNSIGVSNIFAAYFKHADKEFYAIAFKQKDKWHFFDENGKSVKKAFLKAPLSYRRISSGFTYRRLHPIFKRVRPHLGVDYAAPRGTPVVSIGDGRVIQKRYGRGWGKLVRVKHANGYETQYNHLSRFAKGIKVGSYVKQGQVIAYVGSTGYSTGPHLDFRIYENGKKPVNPLTVKIMNTEEILKVNKKAFEIKKDSLIGILNKIK